MRVFAALKAAFSLPQLLDFMQREAICNWNLHTFAAPIDMGVGPIVKVDVGIVFGCADGFFSCF